MIDIKLIRENPDLVKENIKKKFQDEKLPLVDEVKSLDEKYRGIRVKVDELRAKRNTDSKNIGKLMQEGKKAEAEDLKKSIANIGTEIEGLEADELKSSIKAFVADMQKYYCCHCAHLQDLFRNNLTQLLHCICTE